MNSGEQMDKGLNASLQVLQCHHQTVQENINKAGEVLAAKDETLKKVLGRLKKKEDELDLVQQQFRTASDELKKMSKVFKDLESQRSDMIQTFTERKQQLKDLRNRKKEFEVIRETCRAKRDKRVEEIQRSEAKSSSHQELQIMVAKGAELKSQLEALKRATEEDPLTKLIASGEATVTANVQKNAMKVAVGDRWSRVFELELEMEEQRQKNDDLKREIGDKRKRQAAEIQMLENKLKQLKLQLPTKSQSQSKQSSFVQLERPEKYSYEDDSSEGHPVDDSVEVMDDDNDDIFKSYHTQEDCT